MTMTRIAPLAAALTLSLPLALQAQAPASATDQEAVLAVVDRFMLAISSNDFAALASLRLDGSVNTVERPAKPGATATLVTRRPFQGSTPKPGAYRERYWDPIVHVRGSLAMVWTPYEFWIEGKTSHCGIDVFEMVKEDGAWRIGNMMWTVEPDACPALRPPDPGRIRPKT